PLTLGWLSRPLSSAVRSTVTVLRNMRSRRATGHAPTEEIVMSMDSRSRSPRLADLVVRAGAIYAMTDRQTIYRSIALRDQWIVATSPDPHGLDGLISAETRVIDDPTLTLLPAFYDSHDHLLELARNSLLAPVNQARSIAEFVEIIRQYAANIPPGQWIRTTTAWNEANLVEKRLPTALELDAATQRHPMLAQR